MGVELAGEFACHFEKLKKDAKVKLYGSKTMADMPPKAGGLAEDFLKGKNVEFVKERFNFKDDHPGELVVNCTGYTFNSDFMKPDFIDCLAPNGQIYVNDLF